MLFLFGVSVVLVLGSSLRNRCSFVVYFVAFLVSSLSHQLSSFIVLMLVAAWSEYDSSILSFRFFHFWASLVMFCVLFVMWSDNILFSFLCMEVGHIAVSVLWLFVWGGFCHTLWYCGASHTVCHLSMPFVFIFAANLCSWLYQHLLGGLVVATVGVRWEMSF